MPGTTTSDMKKAIQAVDDAIKAVDELYPDVKKSAEAKMRAMEERWGPDWFTRHF